MFSFQSAFVSFVYLKQPIYYITVFWICQVLFRNFCDFLSHLQKHLLFYPINSYWFPLLFRTTCLLYHISFILSSTFFDFFQNLFVIVAFTRRLNYYITTVLICQAFLKNFLNFFQKLFITSENNIIIHEKPKKVNKNPSQNQNKNFIKNA